MEKQVPTFDDQDEMENWVWDNINSGKGAAYLNGLTLRVFNRNYAGRPVADVEREVVEMTREVTIK